MALFGRKKEQDPVDWTKQPGQRPKLPDAAQLMEMAAPFSTTGTGAPGGTNWIEAIVRPQSDFMRQCTCDRCGGPKRLPSPTAYMYCDYCSALIDFDFRALVRGSESIANPADYATTMNELGARSREARAAGDREAYARIRYDFCETWLTATPKAASHRVGDASYRSSLIRYLVEGALVTDFDPSYQACEGAVEHAVLGLRYHGMQVDAPSFWPLLDAYLHQQQLAMTLIQAAGAADLDPDQATDAVRRRIATSGLVQGWMTMFSAEAGEELLDRTGLQGEYQRVEPVIDGASRHCGICGAAFTTVAGARVAICDHCGHELDVGSAEWPCRTCGGLVTLPPAATDSACPYCKGWISRVGR